MVSEQRLVTMMVVMMMSSSYSSPVGKKEVKPDYKVVKYIYTRGDNETDVMDPEAPPFQILPLDFLCEFCQVVILKLKERQLTEPDFEQTIRDECNNSTKTEESSLCDVINRVNLEKLRKGDPKEICEEQNMCNGGTIDLNSMPGVAPFAGSSEKVEIPQEKSNARVNYTLQVEDIAPPYN